jgi:hypothetical protein
MAASPPRIHGMDAPRGPVSARIITGGRTPAHAWVFAPPTPRRGNHGPAPSARLRAPQYAAHWRTASPILAASGR